MSRFWTPLLGLGLLLSICGSAAAQPIATATLEVRRSFAVSTLSPMVFTTGRPTGTAEGEATSSPAVIQVTGDANRLYWIHAPRQLISEAEGAIVSPISVVSRNAGDVSTARLARMDAGGKDYLTVSGQMNIKDREGGPLSLLIPIRVVYE